jgi:hypothetical protein
VVEVLRELIREERDPERRFGPWRRTRWRVQDEASGDIDDDVDVRFLGTSRHSKLRLVAGMVRANRPWRLVPELSGAFAAALATGAYALITPDVWALAAALGPVRLTAAAVLAVVAMVAWLIIDHEMWERPEDPEDRELAVLYNATTAITVAIGVGCLYGGLFVLGIVADRIFVEDGILRETLGRPVTWWDHLTVVWMASSMATVAGALGTGFQSDEAVRKAAYGFRQRERRAGQDEEDDGG